MLLQNTWAMRASGVAPPEVMSYSSTDTAGSNSTTLTITKPGGVQQGDLLLAAMCGSGAGGGESWTGDTGWTEVIDQGFAKVLFIVCGGATATIDQIRAWSARLGQEDID